MTSNNIIINKKIIIIIVHNILPWTSLWAKRVGSSIVVSKKFPLSMVHLHNVETGQFRQCNLSPSLFFEWSKSEKVVTQATNRPREETGNPVIVVNTPDETATTLKTNNTSYNTPQKEKITFKLNYLNNKKARYESHGTFITRCQKKDIISDGLKVYLEPSIGNHSENF